MTTVCTYVILTYGDDSCCRHRPNFTPLPAVLILGQFHSPPLTSFRPSLFLFDYMPCQVSSPSLLPLSSSSDLRPIHCPPFPIPSFRFVSTSANLSKAAWGALEKNQSQLFIRSYELGVVFLPQHFADVASTAPSYFDLEIDEQASRTDRRRQRLAFPLDLPLTPYGQTDEPWLWDVNHTKRLDSHGCTWEPNKR